MSLQGLHPDKIAWFREWVLKKNFLEVVDLHCLLTEVVRKRFSIHSEGSNHLLAVSACEYLISISDIAMDAMIAKAHYKIYEYERVIGEYPFPKTFFRPSHIGYQKLITIIRKDSQNDREEHLTMKMTLEGWSGGEIELSELNGRHFLNYKG